MWSLKNWPLLSWRLTSLQRLEYRHNVSILLSSELLAHGVDRLTTITTNLQRWMEDYEYESVSLMQGSMSQSAVAEPAAFERANYMKALNSFDWYLP